MLRFVTLLAYVSICFVGFAYNSYASASIEPGVSWKLAQERKALISNIHYNLAFAVPAQFEEAIASDVSIEFDLSDVPEILQLDFKEDSQKLQQLWVNDVERPIKHIHEHVVLDGAYLRKGRNSVRILLNTGETSLNRTDEFLYTLFVPDRARTAFPLFDQPNLKATFALTLSIPSTWQAIANGEELNVTEADGMKTIKFAESERISSYLFSFVAGNFEVVEQRYEGKTYRMLHRETDSEKLALNVKPIFDQHFAALAWLENYTGIQYPFQKLDFALIPAFQYGGMEHVGAIQYRAGRLMLDKDASQNQELTRADLIAHEVAHMWFGNLVTMDWFNDVWTKEVFANFMAAKIVNPSFPDVNHDLNFLVRNFPRAYSVDRTAGANAIRQELPNLNEAGTLYGSIIYNKAPIMMQQLEQMLGAENFRSGMQEYLQTFAGGNATWPGLIDILDKRSEKDLKSWSNVWVNTAGMPVFKQAKHKLVQLDPEQQKRLWQQGFGVRSVSSSKDVKVKFSSSATDLSGMKAEDLIFNADGKGYGLFPVDLKLVQKFWQNLDDVEKASSLLHAYEQMLVGNKQIKPKKYFDFLLENLVSEPNQLIQHLGLNQLETIYWDFLPEKTRQSVASKFEKVLLNALEQDPVKAVKKRLFRSLQSIAITRETLTYLLSLWKEEAQLEGLEFSEAEKISLASSLAIKVPKLAETIITSQYKLIENKDRQRRFRFLAASLSSEAKVREEFFDILRQKENRVVEAWVLSALKNLHHPLRRKHAERFIEPSIELLEEIQQTGDIFFPARWTVATFESHRSKKVLKTVESFFKKHPTYNYQLKLKLLQAVDKAKRAYALTGGK